MSSNRKSPRKRPAPGRSRPPARAPRPAEPEPAEGERLQKVLAAAGVASRRAAERLIDEGRVTVDGVVVRVQGMRVDPARARVEVDGRRISTDAERRYLILNKPAGVVTTASDPLGRRTVMDIVRSDRRVFPVGRLDADTLGLLILTDHGELAHRLTHPRFQVSRVYVAEVRGRFERDELETLLRGVRLEDGVARAKSARVVRTAAGRSQIELTLTEGKKHEVRRMLEAVGHPVVSLVRTRYGPISLGRLPNGAVRALTPREAGELLRSVGL